MYIDQIQKVDEVVNDDGVGSEVEECCLRLKQEQTKVKHEKVLSRFVAYVEDEHCDRQTTEEDLNFLEGRPEETGRVEGHDEDLAQESDCGRKLALTLLQLVDVFMDAHVLDEVAASTLAQ